MRFYLKLMAPLGFLAFAAPALCADNLATKTPLQGVYACISIVDPEARLACFDTSVKQLQTAETAGEIVTVDSTQMQTMEREAFGFRIPSLSRMRIPALNRLASIGAARTKNDALSDDTNTGKKVIQQTETGEVVKVRFEIKRYKKRPDGTYRFYLTNGQVWIQRDKNRVDFPRSSGPLQAEIRRAAIGSFLMRINGRGRAIRVRREK